jgi:phosphoglycerate kinase
MPDRPRALAGLPLLTDLPTLDGARVLVRCDFNVPLATGPDGATQVADDFRIQAALPTLAWLLERGAEVTVCSHLGRPAGHHDPRWEMTPVRAYLDAWHPGMTLSDNLRFNPGEQGDDPAFVASLVAGQDCYVDEAFGVAHRAHASVVGPPRSLPSAGGLRLAREVEVLGALLEAPTHPFVAVVGGAKVADKLGVLDALTRVVDRIVVGGGMAFTFLAALGHDVGSSILDTGQVEACRRLLHGDTEFVLPVDIVALEPDGAFGSDPDARYGDAKILGVDLPDGWMGLDIGPESAELFVSAVEGAGTILWNGPVGAFEDPRFSAGTARLAQAVAACPGFTVVGGGDSVRAVRELGLAGAVGFLSTGGGASVEFIEHGDLPGLAALRGAPNAPGPSR